jgi:RNA polymerase sigma-70 factor (ECF subfamily)
MSPVRFPEPPSTDRFLVEAFLRHHDEIAFRALFARHTPAMYGLALRLLGGAGREAEDVVQESWLRACRSLDRFAWKSALATWLVGITINCARETLRRRTPEFPLEREPSTGPANPGERLDLERALAALPDGYRAAIVLHDLLGLTHAEVGERLGIDAGTSKSQLWRARRALRERWRVDDEAGQGAKP